jgi:hypothetical protein
MPRDYIGVAFKWLSSEWLHVGVLSSSAANGAVVIDLLGDGILKWTQPEIGQLCVTCNIDSIRAQPVVTFARRVYRRNKERGIPYGFSSPNLDWFSAVGTLNLGPDRIGLTCGHFVLALFSCAGLPLVRWDTWQPRDEDAGWHRWAIATLGPQIDEAPLETREHFNRVRSEIGGMRCRPTEVGGAANADELPCDFQTAVLLAVQIKRMLPRPFENPVNDAE